MLPPPLISTLFPYTTLFRSLISRRTKRWPSLTMRPISFSSALSASGVKGSATSKRSEEHTSELQSRGHLVCRLLLEKKKQKQDTKYSEAWQKTTTGIHQNQH